MLAVAASAGLRLALEPILADNYPYLVFIGGILATRRLGGRGPALAATALSQLTVWYLFLEPRFSFRLSDPYAAIGLSLFAVIGAGISLLGLNEERGSGTDSPAKPGKPHAHLLSAPGVRRLVMSVGATLALGVLASLLWSGMRRTMDAEAWVQHTYQVLNAAESARSALERAETLQRGYLLTSNGEYLEEYRAATESARKSVEALRAVTADNRVQQARLDEIESRAKARLDLLADAVQVDQNQGLAAAVSLIRSGRNKEVMDQLLARLDAVEAEERGLLEARIVAARAADSRTRWMLGLGSGLLILVLLLAGYSLERNVQELHHAEALLERQSRLIDLSHDAIITMTGDRSIIGWNSGAQEMYGWTAEQASGKVIHELLQTRSATNAKEIDRHLLAHERWEGELIHTRADGGRIVTESRHVVDRDAAGMPAGYLEINRNITERKCAEEALRLSEEKFAKAFATNPAAIAITTLEDGTFIDVNETWRDLFGYEREEVAGRSAKEFQIWPTTEGREQWAAELAEKGTVRGREQTYISKSGALVPTLMSTTILEIAGQPVVLSTLLDISERHRAEEALRKSEERFRALITASSDTVFRMSPDWSEMRELGGRGWAPESDGANRGWLEQRVHPDDQERVRAAIAAAVRTRSIFELEYRARRADGSMGWAFSRAVPLMDGNGEVVEWFGAASDVTQRKRAEEALRESEAILRTVTDLAGVGLVMLDSERRYIFANNAYAEVLRLPASSIVGKRVPDVLGDVYDQISPRLDRAFAGEAIEYELNVPDGTTGTRYYAIHYEPRRTSGRVTGVVVVVVGITERKEFEERLRQLNAALEERVRERTAQLETSNQELEAFSYSVSHDLRAPLRGIDGWSLALIEDYRGSLEPRAVQYLDRVRTETQRMGQLIDDLLQLSRITRVQMRRDAVDLTAVAQAIVARLRETHAERVLEVSIEAGLTAYGDPRLLEVALTNLLDNAVKFTKPRENARIEFKLTKSEGREAYMVRDNGAGFDMAYASTLFGAFQRLHSNSEFPGTGIGLATVQRVIHRHGGRIWAHAVPDCGATFYFTLGSEP